MTFLSLACVFATLCGNDGHCQTSASADQPIEVLANWMEDAALAEFRTTGDTSQDPWPAIVVRHGGPARLEELVFFSSGAIHGSWMMSVYLDKTDTDGETHHPARLSLQPKLLMAEGAGTFAASGSCNVREGTI